MRIATRVRLSFRDIQKLASAFLHLGFQGFVEERINQRLIWDLPHSNDSHQMAEGSSISDNNSYRTICDLAIADKDTRNRFKRNRQYRLILEHVSVGQGKTYLELINENSAILNNLREICFQEEGGPLTYSYEGLGKVSPTQIRYAKVLNDLVFLFGHLSDKKIAEIGIGNGGQAIHLLNFFNNISYSGYDLGPVLELSSLLIKGFRTEFNIAMFDGTNPTPQNVDLVVSNYAFSELNLQTQEMYLEKVITNSRRGYMIYNHIHPSGSKSMTAAEFARKIPGAEIFQEIPLTHKGNVLVVWGHQKNLPTKYFKKINH